MDGGQGTPPAVTIPSRGGDCVAGNAEPALTGGAAWQRYQDMKQDLLASHKLTSPECKAFFKADPTKPDYDATRASYFPDLTARVTAQRRFDGPKTTKSRYDTGALTRDQQNNPNASAIMKTELVCAAFIRRYSSATDFTSASALSQGVARPDADPPTKVYLNTDSAIIPLVRPGTVLHQTLHNMTSLDDEQLLAFVGPLAVPIAGNPITQKLAEAQCAPR
jgi:hypothetical protein